MFHNKAKLMVEGHKKTWEQLVASNLGLKPQADNHSNHSVVAWFHVASLGEFEQGRPLIEKYKAKYPDHFIVLTFFSPSGYEIRMHYDKADLILYLPLDSRKNAERFLDLVQPNIAVFIKYEFWYFYLTALKKRKIPTVLISAIFRENSVFFGLFGSFFRGILNNFDRIFLQNQSSATLLSQFGVHHTEVIGDTRFDRVYDHSKAIDVWEIKDQFVADSSFVVAGSVWEDDMRVLVPCIRHFKNNFKWIVAPHEMHEEEMMRWASQLNIPCAFSNGSTLEAIKAANVLFVNEFGRLSSLYQSCTFAYVGGSFGAGLHNTLEAAVFGPAIFFGNKKYQKFQEAVELLQRGIGFAIENSDEMIQKMNYLQENEEARLEIHKKSTQFVAENIGASTKIMSYINEMKGWKKD